MLKLNLQLFGGRGASSASGGGGGGIPNAGGTINYQPLTNQEVSDMIDEMDDIYDINTKLAIKQYISAANTGNGYSMAQNLNHALETGGKLNANEQYMDTKLTAAMHDLGKDTLLNRGAHADVLTTLGLSNYSKMSDSQLNAALTGASFKTKSYTSTSYDITKNPFLSGSQSGGREVVMNIKAKSSTKCVFGARSQTEVILAKGTTFKVTGARFTGQTVYPRTGGAFKQVMLDIEVE